MLKFNRLIVAIIGVPLLILAYLNANNSALGFLCFINFVVAFGTYEFYDMLKKNGREVYATLGIIASLFVANIQFYIWKVNANFFLSQMDILVLFAFLLFLFRVLSNKIDGSIKILANTLLGIIYVAVFFSYIIRIASLFEQPAIFLLSIQILIWACDTGAGLVGVSIGRKIFKNGFTAISPKKSIEGSIGGLIVTGIAMVIIKIVRDNEKDMKILAISFFVAILIAIVAEIGDLVESLFKRDTNIKDSGKILLGHGGVLDRFDSLIFVLPFVYFLINIIGTKYL